MKTDIFINYSVVVTVEIGVYKLSKLLEILSEKLSIPKEEINDETAYNVAKNWDSINHLAIVSALEEAYGIELDVDEITAMENVKIIKDILAKHGIKDL